MSATLTAISRRFDRPGWHLARHPRQLAAQSPPVADARQGPPNLGADRRRYSPVVIVQHAGQLTVGGQQVNVAARNEMGWVRTDQFRRCRPGGPRLSRPSRHWSGSKRGRPTPGPTLHGSGRVTGRTNRPGAGRRPPRAIESWHRLQESIPEPISDGCSAMISAKATGACHQ
jgi:hypothetical protein